MCVCILVYVYRDIDVQCHVYIVIHMLNFMKARVIKYMKYFLPEI